MYYALGEKPSPNRFWRHVSTTRTANAWKARLPILEIEREVPGVRECPLSIRRLPQHELGPPAVDRRSSGRAAGESQVVTVAIRRRGRGRGALRFRSREYGSAFSDPLFRATEDRGDADAVCLNPALFGKHIPFGIISHYIGDPGYAGRKGMSLAFEYQGDFVVDESSPTPGDSKKHETPSTGLTVEVTSHDWTPLARHYTAHVETKTAEGEWQGVALSVSQFRTADGKPLQSSRVLDKLEIRGTTTKKNPPRFRRFHWVGP